MAKYIKLFIVVLFAAMTFSLTSCGDDDPEREDTREKAGLIKLNSTEYWVTEAYFENTSINITEGHPKNVYSFDAALIEKDSEYEDFFDGVPGFGGYLCKLMSEDDLDYDPIASWKEGDELGFAFYVGLPDEIGGGKHYIEDEGKIIIKKIEGDKITLSYNDYTAVFPNRYSSGTHDVCINGEVTYTLNK